MANKFLEKVRNAMDSCREGYVQEVIESIEFEHGKLTEEETTLVENIVESAIAESTADERFGVTAI